MPTIDKVLTGFASVVCTAVAFSAALSPAIPTLQRTPVRVVGKDVAQDTKFQIVAGLPRQPAAAGETACVSQGSHALPGAAVTVRALSQDGYVVSSIDARHNRPSWSLRTPEPPPGRRADMC